ncbi:MAG TPA: MmcQ/YjbR family DNA-binding protein [Vicinamibacterales bacterium]
MTIETLRGICRKLPDVTEDIKWGQDLAFCIGKKMFAVVNLEPPHQLSFKCTPDAFAELVERSGLIPAPYLARAMWVQEEELGGVLERRELEALIKTSYELVKAKLPKRSRAKPKGR